MVAGEVDQTHIKPTLKMLHSANFVLVGKPNFQMTGIGTSMRTISRKRLINPVTQKNKDCLTHL